MIAWSHPVLIQSESWLVDRQCLVRAYPLFAVDIHITLDACQLPDIPHPWLTPTTATFTLPPPPPSWPEVGGPQVTISSKSGRLRCCVRGPVKGSGWSGGGRCGYKESYNVLLSAQVFVHPGSVCGHTNSAEIRINKREGKKLASLTLCTYSPWASTSVSWHTVSIDSSQIWRLSDWLKDT